MDTTAAAEGHGQAMDDSVAHNLPTALLDKPDGLPTAAWTGPVGLPMVPTAPVTARQNYLKSMNSGPRCVVRWGDNPMGNSSCRRWGILIVVAHEVGGTMVSFG